MLEATGLIHSEEMRKEMLLSDMKRDFLREPEYWNWLARLEMIHSKNIGDDRNSGALSVAKSISGMIFMSK
jgi:U3 small nucleolar RNA-associated protein 6